MQAIVADRYGSPDVLRLAELPLPTPGPGDVLLRVRAVSLNALDWRLLRAQPWFVRLSPGGLRRPRHRVLGADVAGEVQAVGSAVTRFRAGDAVFGDLSRAGLGGFAEYARAPADLLAHKPPNVTFEQAACAGDAALAALQGLSVHGGVQPGQQVLVYGASGGVGTFAVQIGKALGATVTAVCSTRNGAQARALGADRVVDYTRENFAALGVRYDRILAVNGYRPLRDYRRVLAPGGVYVCIGGTMGQLFQALLLGPWYGRCGGVRMGALVSESRPADLARIAALLEAGQVVPPIDRTYPLAQVPDALRYMETEHTRGKVVVLP